MWIRNQIEDAFTQAIAILDYYHAVEQLQAFTNSYFTEKERAENGAGEQIELLPDSR